MLETAAAEERKVIQFDRDDLAPFEQVLNTGSTTEIVMGKEIFLDEESFKFEKLINDPEILRIILTPVNLIRGNKTLEEVREARKTAMISSMGLCFFESEKQLDFLQRGIHLTLEPGELNENGKIENFGVYLSQNKQKIAISEEEAGGIMIKKEFRNLIKRVEIKDGVMEYKINIGVK
jgi:hypothetical protein